MESSDDEDREAENLFKSNMQIDKNSRKPFVGFAWVNNIALTIDLDSNYDIAKARFINTCKSLVKNSEKMLKYKQDHDQELDNDCIERVPVKKIIVQHKK